MTHNPKHSQSPALVPSHSAITQPLVPILGSGTKSDLSSVMAAPMRCSHRSSPVVGWRFHPTPEELITNYLKSKMLGEDDKNSVIGEVNFCKFDPWELPKQAKMKSNDSVWYFICPRDFKYKRCRRLSNRTTPSGYWKPTCKHITIKAKSSKKQIGVKKTLVFHQGRHNKSVRTGWITHEYELSKDSNLETKGNEYTLCKLMYNSVEKTCIGAPNDHDMMLSSDFEDESSDGITNDYQNTTEMTASELSHPTFDKSNLSPTNSTCDENIPNYPMDFDLGGQSSNEMVVNTDCNYGDPDYNLLPALENHSPNVLPPYCSGPMEDGSKDWISISDLEISNPNFINGSPYDNGEPYSLTALDNYFDISRCNKGDQISPAAETTPPSKENDIPIPVKNSSNYWNSLLADNSVDDSLDWWAKICPEQLTELAESFDRF